MEPVVMDEDDWIAALDLESLERHFTQHQQPGHSTAVGLRAVQGVHPARVGDIQQHFAQWPEPCRENGTQQDCCQSAAPRPLQPISAADLLRATLPHHGRQQATAPQLHHEALQGLQQQHWQCLPHQQHRWQTCAPQQHSMYQHTEADRMNQAANMQRHHSGDQQSPLKAVQPAIQQHWPGRPCASASGAVEQPLHQWPEHPQPCPPSKQAQIQQQSQHVLLQQLPQQHSHQRQCQPSWLQRPTLLQGWPGQAQQQWHGPQAQHPWPQAVTQHYQQQHMQQQHQHYAGAALQQHAQQQHHHHHHLQPGHQHVAEIVPRCPYRLCPGVFSFCGAAMVYRKRKESSSSSSGFWGCSTWPDCDFKYFPAQQIPRPELGCEVVDGGHFILVPQPAAEVAVARAGGIRAVLAAAGVTLSHLEVKKPAVLPEPAAATEPRTQQQAVHDPAALKNSSAADTSNCCGAAAYPAVEAPQEFDATSTEPTLATAPDFSWSAEDSLVLRLIDYELVVALLTGVKPPLLGKGGGIPETTLEAFRSPDDHAVDAVEADSLYQRMPASLKAALLPFQQTGVKFGLTRRGRVLIADEMGVGKTVQALALASCYQDEWPLLVVVPASLRLVWAEEIERWLPHVRPCEVTVIEGREDRLCDLPDANERRREKLPAITITSYEMLKRLSCPACQKLPQAQPSGTTSGGASRGRGRERGGSAGGTGKGKAKSQCTGPDHCMAALPWGVVIVDESHNLRTTNSRQADSPHTEAAVAAGSRAGRLILLSGTPSLSRPYDLYRQIDVLVPGLLGRTKEEFAQRYCDRRLVPVITSRGEARLKWNNAGGARLVELHGLLVRRVMIRRLKKDVMAELPPKRRQVVRLPYPPANRWPKEREPGAAAAPANPGGYDACPPQQQQEAEPDHTAAAGSTEAGGAPAAAVPAGDVTHWWCSGVMSAAHRVALAKLPDAIDWLMAALGEAAGSTRDSGSSDRASKGSKPKVPAGPLKPTWKKDLGSTSSSGDGLAAAASAAVSGSVDDDRCDDDDSSSSGGSSAGGGSSSGPKFLVFAHHRDVMDKLAAALSGYRSGSNIDADDVEAAAAAADGPPTRLASRAVGYVRVDGHHDSTERLAAVRKFRSDPSIRVALLSITAAAVGLDFSSASMVVFVELPNEVSLVRQAEDRAHRKGQSKAVNVYFLCAQGTVDDKRWQALNISLSHVSQVHDGQAETLPEPLARARPADAPAETKAAAAAAVSAGVDAARVPESGGGGTGSPAGSDNSAQVDHCQTAQKAGQQPPVLSCAVQQQPQQKSRQVVCEHPLDGAAARQHQNRDRHCTAEGTQPTDKDSTGADVTTTCLLTPSKAAAAAAEAAARLGDTCCDVVTPTKAALVDLTANSPARIHSTTTAIPSGSSSGSKRVRQPLDLTPAKVPPAAARATRSPAAAAAVLAAIAAAAHVPSNKRQRLDVDYTPSTAPAASQQQQPAVSAPGSSVESVPEVWFEVSGHTNRLHYHLSPDGSRPMGLNLPLDWLVLPEEQGTLQQMAQAWDKAWQDSHQQQQQEEQQQQQLHHQAAEGHAGLQLKQSEQGHVPHVVQQDSTGLHQQKTGTKQQVQLGLQQAQSHAATQHEQSPPVVQNGSSLPIKQQEAPPCQQLHTQPTPASAIAAAAGSGAVRSRSSGRGAARPAISSLSLLPFASPTRAAAHPTASAGARSPQKAAPASLIDTSPLKQQQLQTSPALSQKLRRFLQKDDVAEHQQQQQLKADQLTQHHSPNQPRHEPLNEQDLLAGGCPHAGCGTAALRDEAPMRLSFSAVDMIAATPSSSAKQSAGGDAGDQLQLVLDDADGEQQQEDDFEVVVVDLQPQQQQHQQQGNSVSRQHAEQQQHSRELTDAGLQDRHHSRRQQQPPVTSSQPDQQQAAPLLQSQQLILSQREQQQASLPQSPPVVDLPDCRLAPGFLSPSGLVCLSLVITGKQLLELLRLGSAFASDWSELRSVTRNRLAGRVVPADLAAAVDSVGAAAAGSGAHGTGTVRYIKDIQEGDPNLPAGATLETVTVHYPAGGRQPVATYKQAFTGPCTRHCINCFKVVEGAALPADAVLEGGLDLFCSLDCERLYYIRNSSSGIRRALFKLERGVCVLCQLDCHALIQELQQIGKDEPQWMAHRKSIVARMAPKFLERGYATYLDRLLNQATAGNAWHADHIIAVYQGGGGCDLDNLRTLCVPCHATVTKRQARERAEARARRKLGTHDIRQFLCVGATKLQGPLNPNMLKPGCAVKRKRRGGGEQVFLDDVISPEMLITGKTAKRTAPPAASGAGKSSKPIGSRAATAHVQTRAKTCSTAASAGGAAADGVVPQQQQQQQQQQDVDVISILSSPSSMTCQAAAAPAAAAAGTPSSASRPSQDWQPDFPGWCSPPAAPRPAAAAAAASAAGGGKQSRGMRAVLEQFSCGSDSNLAAPTAEPVQRTGQHSQLQQGEQPQQQQVGQAWETLQEPSRCHLLLG